jgi:hypothetical protein
MFRFEAAGQATNCQELRSESSRNHAEINFQAM